MKAATVYVGIVTYNSSQHLSACVDSIQHQSYPHLKLIILDNASQDQSAEWVRQHVPDAELLINRENVGFACAHNEILLHCNLQAEDYYMPLNPDVILLPDYVAKLVELLRQKNAGWGIGKLLLVDEEGQKTSRIYSVGHGLGRDGYGINIGWNLDDTGQFETVREVFGAPGAAPLISKNLIDSLAPDGQLFDPHMFLYVEDLDLDWRARLQGWGCWYTPQAVAYHKGSSPSDVLRVQAVANRYHSVIKNAFLRDLFFYNLPLMVIHCLLRLLITPRRGIELISRILRGLPSAWRERTTPGVSRQFILEWFKWSADQTSASPRTWLERWQSRRKRL